MSRMKAAAVFGAAAIVLASVAAYVINGRAYEPLPEEYGVAESDLINEELICLADSQEEAEQVAQAYGIELISYDLGVAVFKSDKPYNELLIYGKEHDLKQLSVNHIQEIFEPE